MKRLFPLFLSVVLLLSLSATALASSDPSLPAEQVSLSRKLRKEAVLSALYEADLGSLRQAILAGLITSEELTAYYLDRIEAMNDSYNCFITICDNALDVARERDRQLANGNASGILFGIPIVIKDNMDLDGFITTNGLALTDPVPAQQNAAVVNYLLAQGAVILAKTNMSTEAQDARQSYSDAAGETKNAYRTYLSAGGSSGGSAAAASLNFAAAALGTDTNSSLRIPSVLNGCVSLRPTFRLLPLDGIVVLNQYRDTPGAITRSVYDQAIMLDALTGGQYQYTEQLNEAKLEGLRIGVFTELSYATEADELRTQYNLDKEVTAAFENALRELEACGAEVVPFSMPEIFELSEYTLEYDATSRKNEMYAVFCAAMDAHQVEAVVFPSYLSTPLRSGIDDNGRYWNVWSQVFINNTSKLSPCAHLPEIAIPIGIHSLGAGIGMEIAAQRGQEQLLLNIACAYTSHYDHRLPPANAPDTYAHFNSGTLKDLTEQYCTLQNHLVQVKAAAARGNAYTFTPTSPTQNEPSAESPINSILQMLLRSLLHLFSFSEL